MISVCPDIELAAVHLHFCACVTVAKEEKDGDFRRLLRRVTNRAKSTRRQRSKSALGHLQSIHNEHSIDDAVAEAEKHKLSNDELHTTSSPDLDRQKRTAFLSRLRRERKSRASKDESPSSTRRVNEQRSELVQQHMDSALRSPSLQNQAVGTGPQRTRSKNALPLITVQTTKLPSRRTPTSPVNTVTKIPQLYCGAGSHMESVVSFPGHSRDVLLKQSHDCVASGGSSNSSSFPSLFTGRSTLADESDTVDNLSRTKSGVAYLGSSSGGHNSVMRRAMIRNHAANAMKCWKPPESNLTAEQADHSSVKCQENRFSSTLLPDETHDTDSERTGSSTNVSPLYLPAPTRLPFLEFKKADNKRDMSPLSLSVQCGSDAEDVENVRETFAVPTHRLTSKRVWNMNTCGWEDAVDPYSTDSVCSSHGTPDSCNSDVEVRSMNRNARKIIFTRADTAVQRTGPASSINALRLANIRRNACYFSEGDILNAQSRLREHQNIPTLRQPASKTVDIGANMPRTRHTVIGSSCDERLLSGKQTVQSSCRAKSWPNMTVFSQSVLPLHSAPASSNVRRRRTRKVSRFVSSVRPAVPKGSERRRLGRKVSQVVRRHNLAPPLFASWPGKGDVKGSMLAYESSV